VSRRALSEEHLGWLLCTPAVLAMLIVTAWPVLYAVWLSLFRYDLRFPAESAFVGLANYASVLTSSVWWESLLNTLIITVVAALAWKFAFDPVTGFVNPLLGVDRAWLTERWSAFLVIILTEVWKTTPFMALLLLAGLTLVPQDLLAAARVDGAGPVQRFRLVTLPLMKRAILVALLFRTLDAVRIFDTVFVQTRGAQDTETISIVGYHTLITRLNLGLGSAVSVLVFLTALLIALLFIRGLGSGLLRREEGR
jgi:multiple sugar transport system permease protein